MSYLGEKPAQTLAAPTSQYFNGDGSTVAFTLNRAVNVSEDLEVFVNNIQQEPGVGKSYTATGTTLTFDAAPSSGTANVYVVYRGLAEVTTRLEHDPNAALAATTGTFSGDLTVDTDTLYVDSASNLVGIGNAAPNTALHVSGSGVPIELHSTNNNTYKVQLRGTGGYNGYWGSSTSAPFIVANSSVQQSLIVDSSGRVTMPYQPVFSARKSAYQSSSSSPIDPITFGATTVNVGNHFDTSTSQFTAPVAGTYWFAFALNVYTPNSSYVSIQCQVNGSTPTGLSFLEYSATSWTCISAGFALSLSANDTIKLIATFDATSSVDNSGYFSGYLIG